MATGPSPNDLTRQQLDELDTLLQRMLAPPAARPPAPVAPATPIVPAPPPEYGWRVDRPAGPAVNAPHLTPQPEPEPAVVAPMALAVSKPAAAEPYPMRLFDPAPVAEPDPDPIPLTTAPADIAFERIDLAAMPTPAPKPIPMPTVAVEPPAEPAPAGVPMAVWPVFAANRGMETILAEFGPLGRMLTAGPVKHALGWCGVLMLAGAGVWTARGFGLVKLPLPW